MYPALDLITLTEPLSPISEAYRTLRMNLQFASLDRPWHTLLLASPGPEGNKSITLANLAVTLAQVEQRVIMVDSDLRHPSLHEIFGLPNEVGLSTMLADAGAIEHPPLQETQVAGLRLLTSGPLPARPPDLLSSKRMEQVIQALRADADAVLFDAPPVMAVTDAAILASRVDAVLLLVTAGETKREQAQAAVQRLQRVHARLLGAVLTNASREAASHEYYEG
ncbi:MAG: CpsD/CapB family tyrosine-protein kinase [Chloroflexi bacterium]|nr:CpsD/CapB family tyrosine-protein kinase [Chloroflexota bacterium]